MKVSNPLTIVAIFSGLAEIMATVALIKLPPEMQSIFIYFVMAFPSGLVLLFFFVLFFRNTVLYAPSDFHDQSHYLRANKIRETVTESVQEILEDINKNGQKLTEDEINIAKYRVQEIMDKKTERIFKDQILEFLEQGEAETTRISEELGIHIAYALTVLNSLVKSGEIARKGTKYSKGTIWKLNTYNNQR